SFPAFGSNTRLGGAGDGGRDPLETLKREVEACQILGAGVLTTAAIDAQPVDAATELGIPFERAIGRLLEPLRELAEHAAARGVRIGVLNHCGPVHLSWYQEWRARLVDRPAAGATVGRGTYLEYGLGP